jgi:uncharacterized protein YbaR (Trm112 family)
MLDVTTLFACPCPAHGELTKQGSSYISQCCNSTFVIDSGIPVLLLHVDAEKGAL